MRKECSYRMEGNIRFDGKGKRGSTPVKVKVRRLEQNRKVVGKVQGPTPRKRKGLDMGHGQKKIHEFFGKVRKATEGPRTFQTQDQGVHGSVVAKGTSDATAGSNHEAGEGWKVGVKGRPLTALEKWLSLTSQHEFTITKGPEGPREGSKEGSKEDIRREEDLHTQESKEVKYKGRKRM